MEFECAASTSRAADGRSGPARDTVNDDENDDAAHPGFGAGGGVPGVDGRRRGAEFDDQRAGMTETEVGLASRSNTADRFVEAATSASKARAASLG